MERTVCVLGGSGFVGHSIANRLAHSGWLVRIPSRHPQRHRDLGVLPHVTLTPANINDPEQLQAALRGCAAVVNLVGILNESGHDGSGFRTAHVELATKVVAACRAEGVHRLLHMSALRADARNAPSHYLRTKGEAEDLVHAATDTTMHVTSFRPSVIFGPGDSFFNRFAGLLKLAPGVFPLACPQARFAPVFVGDVANAFVQALADKRCYGQRYDLCGPQVYTLRELVEYTARVLGLRRRIIGLSDRLSRLQADLLEYAPGKPFSRDNYQSLQIDSVCDTPFPAHLSAGLTSITACVPRYLAPRRGQY